MERILYIVALIFIVIWIVGFFFYSLGALIHVVLLLAMVVLLIKLLGRRKKTPREYPHDRVR
jgi:hypothetical protein